MSGECKICGEHTLECKCEEEEFPKGSIWQDDSSLKEDGLVDVYVKNDKWEFLERRIPYNFFNKKFKKDEFCSISENEKTIKG